MCCRFVNKDGMIVERFLGLKHVEDTTSNALKKSLLEMLAKYGLSVARLRGQGYDGASNMRGEFNGLQKQIRDENPYAFYVHCFAHQLQLVIVSVTSSLMIWYSVTLRKKFLEALMKVKSQRHFKPPKIELLTSLGHQEDLDTISSLIVG